MFWMNIGQVKMEVNIATTEAETETGSEAQLHQMSAPVPKYI